MGYSDVMWYFNMYWDSPGYSYWVWLWYMDSVWLWYTYWDGSGYSYWVWFWNMDSVWLWYTDWDSLGDSNWVWFWYWDWDSLCYGYWVWFGDMYSNGDGLCENFVGVGMCVGQFSISSTMVGSWNVTTSETCNSNNDFSNQKF